MKSVKSFWIILGCGFLFYLCAPPADALVPLEINFQGYLTDPTGEPHHGALNMTCRLYAEAAGGQALWTESHSNVIVSIGVYNIILGSPVELPSAFFNGDIYLGISVGNDTESLPRTKMTSAVFAIRANVTESLVPPIDGSNISNGSLAIDRFSFTSYQGPQGDKGDRGPQGPQGDQGPAGPVGPTVTTESICVNATYSSDGECAYLCPIGTVLVTVDSPCTVTSAAGTCSATSYADREGSCCICKTIN
jgi:hypothetical protein